MLRPRRHAICAALMLAVVPSGSALASGTDPIATALDRAVVAAFEASRGASVSAAVVFEDGRSWAGAAGVVDPPDGRRATPSTPYPVASVTKMLTAAVAMQLVDEGALDLDVPVDRWLPTLPNADRITLRQLLAHTSGLGPTHPDDRAHQWSPDEALERMSDPVCAPGTCFAYDDNNYVAVGQIVAASTGQPNETVLRDRILEPLRLEHTWLQGFEPARGEVAPALVPGDVPYDDPNGNSPTTDFVTRIGAAGALASTASDLATFGNALFGGEIVDAATVATMTDFEPSANLPCGDDTRCAPPYGLGVQTEIVNGWRTHGHSGSTGALLAYFPEQAVTIAVVTNGGADPYLAARAIAEAVPATSNRVDLYRIPVHGGARHRLDDPAAGRGGRSGARISPDGRHLAYSRVERVGDRLVGRLEVADIDGTHPRTVADGYESIGAPTWSPDGSRIAFAAVRHGRSQLYVIDLDRGRPRRLTSGRAPSDGPAWSPDGSLIAYATYDGPTMEIRTTQPDGRDQRILVRAPIRGRYMGYPSWSPDGTRLAFTGSDGGDTDVQVVTLDDSSVRTLTHDHVPEAEVVWGPDGRIACSRVGDVYLVDPDGSGSLTRVTDTASEEFHLEWYHDGRRILVSDRR